MYNAYYNFDRTPFENTPNPDFFFPSSGHREALAALVYGIREGKGLILISGDVGTGKTLLIEKLKKHLDEDFLALDFDSPKIRIEDIVKELAKTLRVKRSKSDSYPELVGRIKQALVDLDQQGKKFVLLIDEAQELSDKTLDGIRLLSNLSTETSKLIQIVLLGQPELLFKLRGNKLRALSQRIIIHRLLEKLSQEESAAYIQHRLKTAGGDPALFTPEAIRLVHQATNGIPRLINQICDNALLAGYAENLTIIDTPAIQEAIRDASHMPVLNQSLGQTPPASDVSDEAAADAVSSAPQESATSSPPTRSEPGTAKGIREATQGFLNRCPPWLQLAGVALIAIVIFSLGQRLLSSPGGFERMAERPVQAAPQSPQSPAMKSAQATTATAPMEKPVADQQVDYETLPYPQDGLHAEPVLPHDPSHQTPLGRPMPPELGYSSERMTIPSYAPLRQPQPDTRVSMDPTLPSLPRLPTTPAQTQSRLLIDQSGDDALQVNTASPQRPLVLPMPFYASNDPRDELMAIPRDATISKIAVTRYGFWNKTMEDILLAANPELHDLGAVTAGSRVRFPYIANQRLIVREGNQFYIYLKSNSKRWAAVRFERELKARGEHPITFPDNAEAPSAYRTYLGPYASWAEVERKANTIQFLPAS